jgi:hypothetical protein
MDAEAADHVPASFAEFWPHYLRAHENPTSRLLHYIGTFGTILSWVLFALTFVIGAASFHFVEQPARRWLNRNWHGRGAAVIAPARH